MQNQPPHRQPSPSTRSNHPNATPTPEENIASIAQLRHRFDTFKPKVPDPQFHWDLSHGWLLPTLLLLEEKLWKRWDYWQECMESQALPDAPIPRLDILDFPHAGTRKMLEKSLDCIPAHGSWQTWGGWQFFDYLLSWVRRDSCTLSLLQKGGIQWNIPGLADSPDPERARGQ